MFTPETINQCPLLLKEWISIECAFDIEKIFVGLQNGILVPKKDPYIIIQDIGTVKLEMPEYNIEKETIEELIGKNFQLDFYRCDSTAHEFYLKIGSYYKPDWGDFIKYTPPINTTTVSSEVRYLSSYTISVTMSVRVTMINPVNTFDSVTLETKYI